MAAPRLAPAVVLALLAAPAAALAQAVPATPPPPRAGSLGEDDGALAALAFALATAPAAGQLPIGAPAPGASGPAAVELTVEVSAREVTFQDLPRVRAVAAGAARRATWRVERVNLPAHPEHSVAYRDVTVRMFLVATPGALEALLADARRAAASMRLVPAAEATPPEHAASLARGGQP